jgi:hypothetical protein
MGALISTWTNLYSPTVLGVLSLSHNLQGWTTLAAAAAAAAAAAPADPPRRDGVVVARRVAGHDAAGDDGAHDV